MSEAKARRLVELEKDGRKVTVALWDGGQITACEVTEGTRQRCEACEGTEEECAGYIDHLKEQGYTATEIELDEADVDYSLPKFLQERGAKVNVPAVLADEVTAHADVETAEALPEGPEEE